MRKLHPKLRLCFYVKMTGSSPPLADLPAHDLPADDLPADDLLVEDDILFEPDQFAPKAAENTKGETEASPLADFADQPLRARR